MKNIAWRRTDGVWRWRHASLGAGLLDWGEILAVLRRAGYTGRLSLDHLGGTASPATLRRELALLGPR